VRKKPTTLADGAPVRASRAQALIGRIGDLVHAIGANDDSTVEQAVLDLSRARRYLAPLAFLVGAFVMLFEGVKLLFSNWRLSLIQVLPAMWIWIALLDLKVHALHGRSLRVLHGPILVPIIAAIAAITVASFYLNAVFAFAISKPGPPQILPAFIEARSHLRVVLTWGLLVGIGLGVATTVFPRWGRWWFTISLSIIVGIMMLTYVSVPARLIGVKTTVSTRDKLSASVVGGAVGAVVCTPPYVLGRIGILMLGSRILFIPGIVVLTLGLTLQAGATGAVKAIKMSAKLVAGHNVDADTPPPDRGRP